MSSFGAKKLGGGGGGANYASVEASQKPGLILEIGLCSTSGYSAPWTKGGLVDGHLWRGVEVNLLCLFILIPYCDLEEGIVGTLCCDVWNFHSTPGK